MAREVINKIDYAGFTFAGKHTSQFGLYSVSGGDRYNRYLSPAIKNQTAENTGGTGTYYFGSQHTQQSFSFSLAFDSVTEKELREIRQWLNSDISPLILDELPYIQYYVKLSAAPQISFLPFDDEEKLIAGTENDALVQLSDVYEPKSPNKYERVYKGEINVSFIAYEPYGYSVKKWLNEYSDSNKEEWREASGLVNNTSDVYDTLRNKQIKVYNAGDLETNFILTLNNIGGGTVVTIGLVNNNTKSLTLTFPTGRTYGNVIIDTKKRLILADGKIGNNFITSGNFFKLPLGQSTLEVPVTSASIDYKYLYI